MENDKATAWFTLADADAIEQKVLKVLDRILLDPSTNNANISKLATRIADDFYFQSRLRGWVEPEINKGVRDGIKNNLRVEHYYEAWNRTAGYRIRYSSDIIQQEQIKLGF